MRERTTYGRKRNGEIRSHLAVSRREFLAACVAGAASLAAGSFLPDLLAQRRALLLANCSVVDVERGVVLRGVAIPISDGRIAGIDASVSAVRPDATIDLDGGFVIPGLIDAHCHPTLPSMPDLDVMSFETAARQISRNWGQYISRGITTVRDMGGLPRQRDCYVSLIEEGVIAGPRVVCGIAADSGLGRRPETDPQDTSIYWCAGARRSKPRDCMPDPVGLSDAEIGSTARVRQPIVLRLLMSQLRAAEEAYTALPVGHWSEYVTHEMRFRREYFAESHEGVVEPAIHAANRAALEQYRLLEGRTLYLGGRVLAPPDEYFRRLRWAEANLLRMRDAGVLIGCGSGAGTPFVYHGLLHREMEMYGRLGFTNAEVLRCATLNNARILGLDREIGSIAVGKRADLVVLKCNPLEQLDACRDPVLVLRAGRVAYATEGRQ